jgi:two-component system, NarL family, response regulator DevR
MVPTGPAPAGRRGARWERSRVPGIRDFGPFRHVLWTREHGAVDIGMRTTAIDRGPGGRDGQSTNVTIRVFLLDDHEVVRRGVRELLESHSDDVEVVGEAGTAEQALGRIPAVRPDVAVLDVRLPDGDGVEVCREIRSRHPEVHCLMLTSFSDDEALFDSIMAGASGYLLKQVRGADLVDSVRRVAAGQSLLDPSVTARVLDRLRRGPDEELGVHLSDQEHRILDLLAEGLTNRQIGERLCLAEKTIKNYVSNLLTKLGMHRRTEAAVFAVRLANRHRTWG